MWGSAANDAWASGGNGQLWHFDGSTWAMTALGSSPLQSVWGSGPSRLWTGAGYGVGAYHLDGTWVADTLPANTSIDAIWGFGPTDVWAVGWDSSYSVSQSPVRLMRWVP